MNNPFTLSFGKKPAQFISRIAQTNEIMEAFSSSEPSSQIYMLTGVRGSGKTVLMTTISRMLAKDHRWIILELNPARDLLQSLAAKLYSLPEMHPLFRKAKLDLSAFGLGLSIEDAVPVTDIETAIGHMLEQIKATGKRLLISIDEVTNSEYIKVFASAFQIFIRQDYPIFLLMTGLYENIYNLQNEKALTFLYRAPKILLEPLNYTAVRNSYMDIFKISPQEAKEMCDLVKGYSFAFQVLGYLYWENAGKKSLGDILPEFDQYMEEYVYSKIWSELSEWDKKIVYVMSENGITKIKDIRDSLQMKSELFSVYRERLKRKGVVDARQYGHLSLALPRFDVFVLSHFF